MQRNPTCLQVPLGLDLVARGDLALPGQAAYKAVRLPPLVPLKDCADHHTRHVPIFETVHGNILRPSY